MFCCCRDHRKDKRLQSRENKKKVNHRSDSIPLLPPTLSMNASLSLRLACLLLLFSGTQTSDSQLSYYSDEGSRRAAENLVFLYFLGQIQLCFKSFIKENKLEGNMMKLQKTQKLAVILSVCFIKKIIQCNSFCCLCVGFIEIRAEKRRKSEEVDPMDPAAYSDAPKYDLLF